MLPEGYLGPNPGMGEARQSRLTKDEQRTEFTLWVMARSPLILGANLTKLDDFTRSLITNKEVIDINQKSTETHSVKNLPAGFENARVWEASAGAGKQTQTSFAFFNLDDKPVTLHATWAQLGLAGKHAARNLWDQSRLKASETVEVTLPAHGSTLYRVE
jgi:hypothetical protein